LPSYKLIFRTFWQVCEAKALKCFTCVASSEDECNKQGSQSCPNYADACSTITGPNIVMKSCSYKAFCDKAQHGSGGAKMGCCFTDDCNGPPHGNSRSTGTNRGTSMVYNPILILCAILGRLLFCRI
uniref:Si:ch211-113d22.2 n=1 Tax=Latimeria chalumnae TaxID=7897 RepID=H3ACN4_LATCH